MQGSRAGGQAALEAHWRVVDARRNTDEVGGETFESPVAVLPKPPVSAAKFAFCLVPPVVTNAQPSVVPELE